MKQLLRNGIAIALLFATTALLIPLGESSWSNQFLNDRIFSVAFGWLSWAAPIRWSFLLLAFVLIGVALTLLLAVRQPVLWAFGFGAICSAIRFFSSTYWFAESATFIDYFSVYGALLVPPLAAALGAYVTMLVIRRRPNEHRVA